MAILQNNILSFFLKAKRFVLKDADPVFLTFLLLITNYKFSLKIIAIVAIYIYCPNFKFKKNGITYFYVGIIILALFNLFVISNDLSKAHIIVVLSGCLIWTACLMVYHQISLFIEKNSIEKLINTLKILVIINFFISLFDLVKIMYITHSINPYTLTIPPPYGISSGDLIGGVFGEMHLVNMAISSMMLLFFLYQRSFLYSCLALIPLLLTGSNFGTIISVITLLYLFIIKRDNLIRYYIVFNIAIVLIFYIKVTPQNLDYLKTSLVKATSQITHKKKHVPVVSSNANSVVVKSAQEIKNKKIENYLAYKYGNNLIIDSIYLIKQAYIQIKHKSEQNRSDYTYYIRDSIKKAKELDNQFDFGKLKKFDFDTKSGKIISFIQTKQMLMSNWRYLIFGSGLGSFSSRLAFITSGIINDSRILMNIPKYENPLFTNNHKALFKYLLFLDDAYHSVTNLPFCWYNELLGEYGIAGLLLFLLCYLGFFIKKVKLLTYGKLLLVIILVFFLFDYWYQRLSVMVLFELLMLLDIKMQTAKDQKPKEI